MIEYRFLMIKIYHNNKCSKSRSALQYLKESGQDIQIVDYLKIGLTKEEIVEILNLLNLDPLDIIRSNEEMFKTHYMGKTWSKAEWIDALVAFPMLLQRPIVVMNEKAVVGRPPELVKALF